MSEVVLRVFVSSPSDVQAERERVDIVAERLNGEFAGRARLQVQRWKDNFYSAVRPIQESIMAAVQGLQQTDMVICIVWKRAGLELDPGMWRRADGSAYESGTVLEYETARELGRSHGSPELYLFRKSAARTFTEDGVHEQIRQRDVLEAVLGRWTKTPEGHNAAGYHRFADADDFEHQVEGCLRHWLEQRGVSRQAVVWNRTVRGSPFRGLDAFEVEHADVFFGRDADISRAVRKLQQAEAGGLPFLLVVGASGAGKSSLLRAGLRRRITTPGTFRDVAVWRSCLVVPGSEPLAGLARALFAPEALGPELAAGDCHTPELLAHALEGAGLGAAAVQRALERVARQHAQQRLLDSPRAARLLICVDQVERLLLEADHAQADAFSRVLRVLVEQRLASAVLALRSDTYAKFLQCEDLVALLEKGGGRTYNLLPPTAGELTEIVNRPVEACDPPLSFDVSDEGQSLADAIVGDVQGGDALPLLQMTLKTLFECEALRGDGVLRRQDYPGIDKAVSHTAESVYLSLGAAAQGELRALVAALVGDVLEDEHGNRLALVAPVDREKFEAGRQARTELVKALIDSRLLTSERAGAGVLVRPVHDAFLRTWPRASKLIAEHAPYIHVRHTLAPMADDWRLAPAARRHEHLATGALLAGASALREKMADTLSQELLAFIDASRAAERRRRRLRTLALVSGVAMVVGLLQTFSYMRTSDAQAGQLVAEARGALARMEHARAEIAAAAALRLHDSADTRNLLLSARLGGVSAVARSPDTVRSELNVFNRGGDLVASIERVDGQPPAVRIASARDGQTLWRLMLPAQAETPDAIALGEPHDGSRLIAVSWPDEKATIYHVGLWTLRDGSTTTSFRELATDPVQGGHSKRVPGLAFHPLRDWLATGGEEGKLTLWDVSAPSARLLWQQAATHQPNVHGIAFSKDGQLLATGGGDYVARVWRTADMVAAGPAAKLIEPKYTLSGHRDSIFAVAFNPAGTRLATGGYDRTVRIWDFELATRSARGDGQPPTVATLSDHDGTVFSIAYSEDGRLLSTGASDGSAALWDATTGRLLNRIRLDDGIVRSVVLARFEEGLRVGGEHGWSVWSISGNRVVRRLWNGGATVSNVAFDATGHYLAAAGDGDQGRVRVWGAAYGPPQILDPQSPDESINSLAFSPDARWLAAAGTNKVLHVWDRGRNGWTRVPFGATAPSHRGVIWGLCFDTKGRWLASSNQSPDVQIKRWNTQDWSLLDETPPGQLHDSVYALACDGAADRLVSGDSKEAITVRETAGLGIKDTLPGRHAGELNVWSVAVMREPHAILSGHADGKVRRWTPAKDAGWPRATAAPDISTSAEAAKVNPTVYSISHDARHGWVAAGGVGPSVEIYDARTLRWLRSLRGHSGTVWWVTFDEQGSRLAYGGLDGIVRVIDIDSMLKVDAERPDDLYAASQRATGLTVTDGVVMHRRPNAPGGR